MSQPHPPIVRFLRMIEEARPPQRADQSAIGTFPTRSYRHCEAIRRATGFGWWVFPPTDLRVLWDGHDIFWHHDSLDDWLPLQPSAQFPWFASRFDDAAPDMLKGCAPPFLTALPEPGLLQIWTGLMARTAPDWSLLVRAPANLPCPPGYGYNPTVTSWGQDLQESRVQRRWRVSGENQQPGVPQVIDAAFHTLTFILSGTIG